jgi:hypothetical protein
VRVDGSYVLQSSGDADAGRIPGRGELAAMGLL